jgi:DEAD/DEAH box helicase domain-containing protein
LPAAAAAGGLHFMGGIHAAEHAMIGLFPLLAIADRGDVGGISYTRHPQIAGPAIFVYDGVAGGAGLAQVGFRTLEDLLARTQEHVASCPCEDGCPACIQSPRCGNGNKPLDKQAAILTLRVVRGEETIADPEGLASPEADEPPVAVPALRRKHGITRGVPQSPSPIVAAAAAGAQRVVFFDVETQRSAEEVGGWAQIGRMGLALAVVYDDDARSYRTYYEADVEKLLLDLVMADRVVGFNIDRFDLAVLGAYTRWDLKRIRSFDLLARIHEQLGVPPPSPSSRGSTSRGEGRGRPAEPALVEGGRNQSDRAVLQEGRRRDAAPLRAGTRARVPPLPGPRGPCGARSGTLVTS